MEKVTRKVKQALSMLLVATMVITMVSQTTLSTSAQETVESVSGTAETVTEKTEETTAGTVTENVEEIEEAAEGEENVEETEEAAEGEENVEETEEAAEGEENVEETEEAAEGEENVEETEEAVEGEEIVDETEETTDTEESTDEETEDGEETAEEEAGESKADFIRSTANATALEHTLTFAPDAYVSVKDVSVNGLPVTPDENKKVTVPEGREVTFRLQADTGYKVGVVTYQEGEDGTAVKLRPVTSEGQDTYVLDELTADTTVTVTTEPDETACNTLEFDVTANELQDGDVITIGEKKAEHKVTISYPADSVELTASVAGREILPDAQDDTSAVYTVTHSDVINLTVIANDYYQITGAQTTVGTTRKNEKTAVSGFSYSIIASADAATEIQAQQTTEIVITPSGGEAISPVKGVYGVQAGTTYEVQVKRGGKAKKITAYRLADSANADNIIASGAATYESGNLLKVIIDSDDAGKTLTLDMVAGTGEEEYPEAQIKLKIAPAVTKVSVAGIKNGKLSQGADTTREYKLTITPKTAANTLGAYVTTENVTAEVDGDILRVTVNAREAIPEQIAVVNLYDKARSDGSKEAVSGGQFSVTATAPALVNVKPTVSLKDADDCSLTLQLGSKGIEQVNKGNVYYKVVVKAADQDKNGNERPNTINASQIEYVERTGDAQNFKVVVNRAGDGKGCAWNFDVTVSLVQTKDKAQKASAEGNIAFETVDNKVAKSSKPFSTKAPAYTTKLGIKKLATKLYTGQTDIEVAQVTFDKNATFRKIEVTNADDLNAKGLAATVAGDKIQVTVGKSGSYPEIVGRYTIQVAAVDGNDVMKTAATSFTVDVLQGIEDLTIVAPGQVYKVGGKTASFATAVKYNNNVAAASAFNVAKKVTWSLTDAEGKSLSDAMAKLITVNKSGKVTVAGNYIVSADANRNTFRVVATAADYKGNTVTGSAEFVITAQAAELGEVVILSGNPYNGGKDGDSYDVVARSNGQVSAYKGTYAFVLKKDAVQKDQYSYAEFMENVADVQVTFTSGNKKALEIDNYDGELIVHSGAKNVKITATATDGSKVTSVLSGLNVAYIDTEELGLEIVQVRDDGGDAWKIGDESRYKENQADSIEFYGKKDTCFDVSVKQLLGESWEDLTGITDYTLKADGAKFLEQHVETGMYELYAVKDTITLTLTDKPKDKAQKTVKTYVLHNASVSTQKAPKVTTKDVLYGGIYYKVPQTVTYTVSSMPKDYKWDNKYALVTVDVADSSSAKNIKRYNQFIEYADSEVNGTVPIEQDGTITLYFDRHGMTDIPAGSYKLNVSLGTVDGEGRFIADTKPAAVTLKAVAQKTVKTSLNSSYTMSAKDGTAVELKLSNSKTCLTDATLANVNIKGTGNKFTKYFEIVGSAEDGFRLRLKDDLNKDDLVYITGKAAKNDLTGWVYYKYKLNDDAEAAPAKSGEGQIKITFKDTLQKYSLTGTTIYSDDATASVRAIAGKKEAAVSYAVATEGYFGVSSTSGSTVFLYKKADAPKEMPKKHMITLYIVPAGGCHESALESLYNTYVNASKEEKTTAKTELETAIRTYGVKVSTTISVSSEKNPASGTGEKVYVSASAETGLADGSAEHPFTTIRKAVEQSEKGAEIIIGDGTYEPFTVIEDFSGEEDNISIIRAADRAHPVIQVPASSSAGDSIGISMENVSYVRIEGLEITGGTHGIYYESNAEVSSDALCDITIRNCKIHNVNGVHGIGIYGANAAVPVTGLKIEECEVYDCLCGDSESVVVNGNIDGFEICNNNIHDNNNIGIDMIGFEGTALQSASYSGNRYDADYVRNGKCYGNTVSGISAEGNDAYLENGVYSLCAAGIYVDGGQNIKIYDNRITNCDIGIEVATEHNPAENSLFQVSGIEVYNNEISECTGFAGLAFGGYDAERGFTVDCRFHHNTLRNNPVQIVVQRSKNNEIDHNTIIGGTTVIEYNAELPQEEMKNDFHDNSITQ